ncbi:MAG: hypothetical protein PHC88_10620 [Terrimicrobiaceae bacterium]|nr:hypothetical protein [Terrimicrobiaceae bacterium]
MEADLAQIERHFIDVGLRFLERFLIQNPVAFSSGMRADFDRPRAGDAIGGRQHRAI